MLNSGKAIKQNTAKNRKTAKSLVELQTILQQINI